MSDKSRRQFLATTGALSPGNPVACCVVYGDYRELLDRKLSWNPGKQDFIGDQEASARRSQKKHTGFDI